MKRSISLVILMCLALVALSGCAGAYTNIEPLGDGKYRVTGVKASFFRLKGMLLECQGQGTTMRCKKVAVQ